ncbi:MAG: XdhC family protein [Gammaproteobacteria bacterium]|nr:XdhC family protein [Gammaproteobacteria bacterium]
MNKLIEELNTPSLESCFSSLQREGKPLALATVIQAISPTSGKPGDKALVSAEAIVEGWIGGGCAQPAVIEAAGTSLETGEPSVIRVGPKGEWQALEGVVDFASGCLSGGTLVIFIEPMIRQPTLNILGNSPAAHKLSTLAGQLDFSVTATPSDFSQINSDYIVIATQGKDDRVALKAALASSASHIAMIASAKKIAGLKASLEKSGIEPEQLDRIHSPAGIEIGAITPAEIALSVLAELVRVRRGNTEGKTISRPSEKVGAVSSGSCCGG